MSVVYAVGAWTTLGSMFYLGRKKRKPLGTTLRQPSVGRPDGVIKAASLCRKYRVYSAKPLLRAIRYNGICLELPFQSSHVLLVYLKNLYKIPEGRSPRTVVYLKR
ncbi:hypothetical protein GH733_009972 [Mirounga leonina]|nr:hypothetical protein GH733_009972 [Mirounga leonina]